MSFDTSCAGLVQAMVPWRFRLVTPGLKTVKQSTRAVRFDFGKKSVQVDLIQTVQSESFTDALHFANRCAFSVEALDGSGDAVLFSIKPVNLKLIDHKFDFDYASPSHEPAVHRYVFSYDDLSIYEPLIGEPAEHDGDPRFPTPQEAILELEETERVPLDLAQEMRFTPDHPDQEEVDKVRRAPKKN